MKKSLPNSTKCYIIFDRRACSTPFVATVDRRMRERGTLADISTMIGEGRKPVSAGSQAIFMKRLLEAAASFGVDTAKVLRKIELSPEALDTEDVYYTLDQHIQSIALIKSMADIPGLGLMVGSRISIADLGIMGYAMLSSRSFGKAIEVAMRFQRLTDPVLHMTYKLEDDEAIFTIEPLTVLGEAFEYDVEETLAIWARLLRDCIGNDAKLRRVGVTWRAPEYKNQYHDYLGCRASFEQETNHFSIPARLLGHPLTMANEQASRICEQECEALLKELSRAQTIVDSVRRVMIRAPGQFLNLDTVARSLHMSQRTLRRRLAESGTTFRKVTEKVRMQLAVQYLSDTELSIEQVAFLIGYTEASNFHRAFKRKMGKTPNEVRARINS